MDEMVEITHLFIPKDERMLFVSSASKMFEPGKGKGQKAPVVVKNENNVYELLLFMLGAYKNLSIAKENRGSMAEKGVLAAMLKLLKSLMIAEDELYSIAEITRFILGKTNSLNV